LAKESGKPLAGLVKIIGLMERNQVPVVGRGAVSDERGREGVRCFLLFAGPLEEVVAAFQIICNKGDRLKPWED